MCHDKIVTFSHCDSLPHITMLKVMHHNCTTPNVITSIDNIKKSHKKSNLTLFLGAQHISVH